MVDFGQVLTNYTHYLTESGPTGYHFVSFSGTNCVVQPTNGGYSATVTKGDTTTCTFTNARDQGSIKFTKVVVGGGDPDDWTFHLSGDGTAKSGDTKSLNTGTYTVTESGPDGYFVSSTDGTVCKLNPDTHAITLTVTKDGGNCVITNTKLGSIKIIKDTNPDSNQHFQFDTTGSGLTDFSLSDDHSKTFSNLYSGGYTITEQPTTGWDLNSINGISCTGNEGSVITIEGNTLSINLGTSKDVVCTFHNTERGSISGYKWNDLNGNGIRDTEKVKKCIIWFICYWDWDYSEPTLPGWTINLENSDNTILQTTVTDHDGDYKFQNVLPGTYKVCEIQKDGWAMTYPNKGNDNLCQTVTIDPGQDNGNVNFGNIQYGSVTVTKFDDINQNGIHDEGENLLGGWTINLQGKDPQVTGDGGSTTFENIIPGSYELSENLQQDWIQTNIYCDGEKVGTQTNEGYYINITPGANINCYIGNFQEHPGVSISKTNDKPDGISAGQVVDYSVTLTNTGNIPVTNITIQDVLPAGFTYITGSSTGATTADPNISGSVLSWTGLGTLGAGESITIHYQAQTASDLANGIYTNFATCSVSKDFRTFLAELDSVDEGIQCDPAASSTVSISNGISYGGNLTGQVLGASTSILPATGSPTGLLAVAVIIFASGLVLRFVPIKNGRKGKRYAKN